MNKTNAAITLTYSLTIDDIVAFNKHHLLNSPEAKKSWLAIRLVMFGLVVAATVFCAVKLGAKYSYYPAAGAFIGGVLYMLNMHKLIVFSTAKKLKKNFSKGNISTMIGPRRLTIANGTIEEVDEISTTKIELGLLERIEQTDQYIFIYISSIQAFVVPEHAFSNALDMLRFLDLLHNKA